MGERPDGKPPPAVPLCLDINHQRNHLAGVWAAELLGLFGLAAQDYIRSVMHPGHAQEKVHGDDHDAVVGMLSQDLAGRATIGEIREKMVQFVTEARRQIMRRQ
jgi:hypothetical protein